MGELIDAKNKYSWYKTLDECGNFDIYHTPEWNTLHASKPDEKPYLYRYSENDVVISIPLIISVKFNNILDETVISAYSAYGYPGPLTNQMQMFDPLFENRIYADFKETLMERGVTTAFLRFHPVYTNKWVFSEYKMLLGPTVLIRLDVTLKDQLADTRKSHRYELRKSLKNGLSLQIDESLSHLDAFARIYEASMVRLNAGATHFYPPDYFKSILSNFNGNIMLAHALMSDEIVASSMFLLSSEGIQYHLSGTNQEHMHLSPSRAILETMREWGTKKNFKWLHLGGGVNCSDDSLYKFKRGFSSNTLDYHVANIVIDTKTHETRTKAFYANVDHSKINSSYFPVYSQIIL